MVQPLAVASALSIRTASSYDPFDANDGGAFAGDGVDASLRGVGGHVDPRVATGLARGAGDGPAVIAFAGADDGGAGRQCALGVQRLDGEAGAEQLEGVQSKTARSRP